MAQKSLYFMTLTYNTVMLPVLTEEGEITRAGNPALDPSLNVWPTLDITDHQNFMKRLRIYQKRKGSMEYKNEKITFFHTAEYGPNGTRRPHLHYLIFGMCPSLKKHFETIWPNGFVKIGSVSKSSINYVAGHKHKKWLVPSEHVVKPYMTCSKGIGKNYIASNKNLHKATTKNPIPNGKIKVNGYTHILPRYYKSRIFNKFELDYLRVEAIRETDKNYNKLDAEGKIKTPKEEIEAYQDRRKRQLKQILKEKL